MPIPLVRLIIYVRDVVALKAFYQEHFDLSVIEEIKEEWVVFRAGGIELALHLVGKKYRRESASGEPEASEISRKKAIDPATKFVFAIESDLAAHREKLRAADERVGNLKRYEGFPYEMYDGRDPEGNIFQVMRFD